MVLPVFPRNIPYWARPKSLPFQFFSALRDIFFSFFRNFFFLKGSPCIFLMFCDRMDVGKSQRVPPFSFFRHCEIFSRKKKIFFNFFVFCDRMDVEKSQRVPPFSFFGIVRFFPENKKKFFNFFMFCDRMDVEKPQRVPPFSFSAL